MSLYNGHEKRYLKKSKAVHLMSMPMGQLPFALCGLQPWHSEDWRGTGSQDEYEAVDTLPLCKTCVRVADANLFLPKGLYKK